MANLDELAIGIATALAGIAPEPLPVQVGGQTIDEAAYLVRAVVSECADAGIRLHRVTVDPELFSWLTTPGSPTLACPLGSGGRPAQVLFFREPATSAQ